MRILMLGWEFPPFITGGLGTACYGLTQAMERLKTEILFLLPIATEGCGDHLVQRDAAAGTPFVFAGKATPRYVAMKRVPK